VTDLSDVKCVPCTGNAPPATDDEIAEYLPQIPEWRIIDRDGIPALERVYEFEDFETALDFTDAVGEVAELEGHHPAILTEWGRVTVWWWTHKIRALHNNDFAMAAKTDRVFAEEP
jgi:4a-hydroxytetrahydrobiopterin dehydratase